MNTILGRNPALWLALISALLNALVVLQIIQFDDVQLAALNVLAVAVIGIVANEADPTSAGTFAATTHPPIVAVTPARPGTGGGGASGSSTPGA